MLVQGISRDKGALGFFGFAYYAENRDKLKIVPIDDEQDDNGAGPVAPSLESVGKGTYQPLSRPLFIYLSKNAMERPEVKAFVEFYLTNAEQLVPDVGYVPLSAETYAASLAEVM